MSTTNILLMAILGAIVGPFFWRLGELLADMRPPREFKLRKPPPPWREKVVFFTYIGAVLLFFGIMFANYPQHGRGAVPEIKEGGDAAGQARPGPAAWPHARNAQ